MINFTVSVTGATGPQAAQIAADVLAAGNAWAEHLVGSASLEIEVAVGPLEGGVIARAGSKVGYWMAPGVYQMGATAELLTGIDPNGADFDIAIKVDPDKLRMTDAVEVFTHELGHAFSFSGWGQSGAYTSSYDALVTGGAMRPVFTGKAAQAIHGGPVPLASESPLHYGVSGLMDPYNDPRERHEIEALDLAFLADSGAPVREQFGSAGNDQMRLTHGEDIAYGGFGNDTMFGNRGVDTLYGWAGDDLLHGGKGNDLLFGGSGNDTLRGDLGDDTLDGGPGTDVFVFGPDTGRDVIDHWDYSQDRILLPAGLDYRVEVDVPGLTVTIAFGNSQVVLSETNFFRDGWLIA